jgi:hypothetical protein
MKLKDYLSHAVFFTGNKKPTSLRNNQRICYRTVFTVAGVKFLSRIHLGIEAEKINWSMSDGCLFKIYDFCVVQDKNILIEQAKTRAI